jgi:hypothetical protein
VREGTFIVDGSGAVVLGWPLVGLVELDPPELQDARARTTATSTD